MRIKRIKKARGRPPVSPVVWSLICDEVQSHPGELRKVLAYELENKIKLKGEVPPTQQTLIKLISKARNSESSPEDYPWHIDAFDKCPVPADALPVILEIQKHIDRNLSIRVVKWLARIYVVLKGKQFLEGNKLFYCLYCYLWASMYANRERVSEISKSFGTPISFDSSDLDVGLLDDNPLSLLAKPLVLDLLSEAVVWLIGAEENVVSKEQKEHFGILLAQRFEEALIGHSLVGFESGKPGAAEAWLLYVFCIYNALKSGYFEGLSKEEAETLLLQIRKTLPEFWEAYRQSNQDSESYSGKLKSLADKHRKIWETLKVKKEG